MLRTMLISVGLLTLGVFCPVVPGQNAAKELSPDQYELLQKLIKPTVGESRWEKIDWLVSVHEARKRAAEEGKPILIWSGGGAPPLGGC